MSRLLINGRDWRRLVAVTAGVGFKRYFSSTWDNSDVVTEPLRRSIVRNWEDRYVDDYRDPILLEQDNLRSKSNKKMLDSEANQILFDDFLWRIDEHACNESMGDYSDMVMTSLSCSKGFDGLQYLDDVFTRRATDLGLPPRPSDAATLFKTGMLSDPDNGTSMVQGANRSEKRWEIVWFASTASTTRASSGFCYVSSVSSDALGQIIQYAGLRYTSKVWSPDVTLAIAAVDPHVGGRATRKCLISVLENNQMSNYFKNAKTQVYFHTGGSYQRYLIPLFQKYKVQRMPSTAASQAFVRNLKFQQPMHRLRGSKDAVYVLRWNWSKEKGLGFHGLWAGEVQQKGDHFIVQTINNDIRHPPYSVQIGETEAEVSDLPQYILEEMDRTWSSRPPNQDIVYYAACQFLKHCVQEEEVVLDDYWRIAHHFSKVLTHEKLLDIMERNGFEWGKYYDCEHIRRAVSDDIKSEVRVTTVTDEEYGVVTYGFEALLDYNLSFIDHVNTITESERSTFGCPPNRP